MMRSLNVPDRIIAAWHGHAESIVRGVYDHANPDQVALLYAADALSAPQGRTSKAFDSGPIAASAKEPKKAGL